MLQFRLTEKVRTLFCFDDDTLSEPMEGDAFLGNWYVNIISVDSAQSLLFLSEKTYLSFVLLDVRPEHADVMPNGFINGLEHLLQTEKFAERSIRRIFEGIDIMEITGTTDRAILGKLAAVENLYLSTVQHAGGLDHFDILDAMKAVNRTPDRMLEGLSPLKATQKLLRNSDLALH